MIYADYKTKLALLQCLVGKRHGGCMGRINLHHVAEGSGVRYPYSLVPICEGHHTGGAGFHKLGTKRFCSIYRVPGESEYGLLIWLLEELANDN